MKRHVWKALRAWLLVMVMLLSVLSGMGSGQTVKAATKMGVTYTVHVQTFGDKQGWVSDGETAGTSGMGKRLEEIQIKLTGTEYTGSVRYKTHIQTYGWQNWVQDGTKSGSRGQSKRLEGIEIELTGEVAKHYDVYYRVHCQTYGWMAWVKNGVMAGTSGQSKRLEAIEIKLLPKTEITDMGVRYRTHVQTFGWQGYKLDGEISGTTGQSKRLEAIEIELTGNRYSGGIAYRTHIQTYGWEKNSVTNGALSGTFGQAKRLEAIEISLYGEVASYYNVYYRVHAQSYGWLGWAKNGETSGTSGMAKRLEAIEIRLIPKNSDVVLEDNGNPGYIKKEVTTSAYTTQAQEVVALCNIYRQQNGVKNNLTLDPVLTQAANIRAKEIVEKFSHTRPNGTSCFTVLDDVGYSWRAVGENIAVGYPSSASVMEAWMDSEGHRKNILNSSYNRIGVGYYADPKAPYRYYWVQIFSD